MKRQTSLALQILKALSLLMTARKLVQAVGKSLHQSERKAESIPERRFEARPAEMICPYELALEGWNIYILSINAPFLNLNIGCETTGA
jgi:hypothetical protein